MEPNKFWVAMGRATETLIAGKEDKQMRREQVFNVILGILVIMALTLILGSSAWAAEHKTLHKFKLAGGGGRSPEAGLTLDAAGNLYGTTDWGGAHGHGTVFELTPKPDGSWVESVLHSFNDNDAFGPGSSLIFDAAGNLYGTTFYGGHGHGTVFKLTPNGDGSWTESVIHSFNYVDDGAGPYSGLIFDAAGNLYGTTYSGGAHKKGTVFELTPNGDGSWVENVLHSFNGSDGRHPRCSLLIDAAGNLYGTTAMGGDEACVQGGGFGCGTVFELTPNGDGSWVENVLHSFNGSDGDYPYAGVIFDAAGNLYGTTELGGAFGHGTVFELTPNGDGSWREHVLHKFDYIYGSDPMAGLIFDAAGNLYGTTLGGGSYGYGVVFKLRPTPSGAWRYSVLLEFSDRPGAWPESGLVLDQTRNLYGTTVGDGSTTFGSVFEITP
jgi:uncharacterized repeat protein (TIGR03803 family)